MSKVLFNGKVLREPQSATQLRIGIPPQVNPDATNRVLVIGPSTGGLTVADNQLYTFNSASDAAAVLRSGDALRAIRMIFAPSPSVSGAAQVDFIRMDVSSTYATAQFTSPDITFQALDRGVWTNQITIVVTGASTTRQVTVRVPLPQIQGGTDGAVAGSVFTSATARFKLKGAQIGDSVYLGGSPVNAQVFQIASVDSDTQVTLVGTPTAASGQTWAHFVYAPDRVSPLTLASNTDIANWITDYCSDVLTTTLVSTVLPTAGTKNLSGGTVALGGTNEITNALVMARTRDVRHIYVARACGGNADELEYSGLLRGHLLNYAEVPAIGYLGAGLDKTRASAITYAATLNSARLVYTFQSILDRTEDGLSTEKLPGYFLAAKICGLAAGVTPQTPLTRKAVDVQGLMPVVADGPLDRPSRENLLKAGVLHIYQQPGNGAFIVNQGISTTQKQDNLFDTTTATSPEISLTRICDTLLYNMQISAQQQFVGTASSLGQAVIESWARNYLESERGNLIIDWRNLSVSRVADRWNVAFAFVPNYPINYVLVVGTVIGS